MLSPLKPFDAIWFMSLVPFSLKFWYSSLDWKFKVYRWKLFWKTINLIQYSNYGIINYFIPYLFLFWRDDEPLLWSSTPLLYCVLLFSSTLLRTEDERIWSSPFIKEHPVPSPTTSFVSSFGGILVLWLLLIGFWVCLFTNQQLLKDWRNRFISSYYSSAIWC